MVQYDRLSNVILESIITTISVIHYSSQLTTKLMTIITRNLIKNIRTKNSASL